MPAPPRIRFLPLTAIALAMVVIYLSWSQQRPSEPVPRPAEATATTSPTGAIPQAAPGDDSIAVESQADRATISAADAPQIAVTGRITDTAGVPLGGIAIELQPRGDETGASIMRARSDQRGEFDFDAVTPGRPYQLRVAPTDTYAGHSDEAVIFDADTPRLDIALERIVLVDADGIIVDTSQAPVANFTLRLRSASANIPDRVVTSDATGYFRLEDFPAGELEINTSGRDFYRIRGLELTTDAYNKLTLMVDRGDYQLLGWIGDENGAPVSGARVTLKGALRHGDYHSYTYRSTLSDNEGQFAFADLGSYRYTLGVYAAGYETQVRDHEFQSFAERLEIRLQPLPVN